MAVFHVLVYRCVALQKLNNPIQRVNLALVFYSLCFTKYTLAVKSSLGIADVELKNVALA